MAMSVITRWYNRKSIDKMDELEIAPMIWEGFSIETRSAARPKNPSDPSGDELRISSPIRRRPKKNVGSRERRENHWGL